MITGVYFDLDGVLADFVGGAFAWYGRSVPMSEVRWGFLAQIGFENNETEFWKPLGRTFWATLGLLADGMAILAEVEKRVGRENIALLSSPCETEGCCDGKRDWVAKHLPAYRRRLFLGSDKSVFAAPDRLLIDDHEANCEAFAKRGGRVLLVPRPWNLLRVRCDESGNFPDFPLAGLDAVLS